MTDVNHLNTEKYKAIGQAAIDAFSDVMRDAPAAHGISSKDAILIGFASLESLLCYLAVQTTENREDALNVISRVCVHLIKGVERELEDLEGPEQTH